MEKTITITIMMETFKKKKWHILLYSLTRDKVESPHKKAERQRPKKQIQSLNQNGRHIVSAHRGLTLPRSWP